MASLLNRIRLCSHVGDCTNVTSFTLPNPVRPILFVSYQYITEPSSSLLYRAPSFLRVVVRRLGPWIRVMRTLFCTSLPPSQMSGTCPMLYVLLWYEVSYHMHRFNSGFLCPTQAISDARGMEWCGKAPKVDHVPRTFLAISQGSLGKTLGA